MKLRILSFMAIAVLALSLTSAAAQQKEPDKDDQAAAEMQKMMKLWEEASTPGLNHKVLDAFLGKWQTDSTFWIKPEAPSVHFRGDAEYRSIMGGRYVISESSGTIMGQPFTGMGLMGYDNMKKKYFVAWIDSGSTALFTADGTLDRTGKVITLLGTMDDPTTGEYGASVKYVFRIVDKNKHVFEMYSKVGEPDEFKGGEIVFTRK